MIYSSAPNWTGTIGAGGVADAMVTTVPLSSTVGLNNGDYYILTIDRVDAHGTKTPGKMEVVAGQLSGSNLINCTRGVEGTAQAHSAGAVVEMLFTAKHWNELKTDFNELNTDFNELKSDFEVEHNTDGTHKRAWVTVADAATITFDISQGNKQKVTLGGNRTLAVSNVKDGQVFIIKLTQDATGSRTVTWWSGISWVNGEVPTLTTTANKSDVFGFVQTGTNTYDGFIVGMEV